MNDNPVPGTATPPEPGATPGTPPATGAGESTAKGNDEAGRARRKIAALEKQLEDAQARLTEAADAAKSEAEREREKAIKDATAAVEARYKAEIARKELEASVLLKLGAKVGPDAAKLLVPSVLATDNDLTIEDVDTAVEKVISALSIGAGKGPGGQGGSPSSGVAAVANPWKKESWNLTEQFQLLTADPAKARALASAAGVHIP